MRNRKVRREHAPDAEPNEDRTSQIVDGAPAMTRALRRAARIWGIEPSYRDCEGREVHASERALLAMLEALGAPLAAAADAADAHRARRRELAARTVEPVTVLWEDAPSCIRLRLPQKQAHGRVRVRITTEDGHSATREHATGQLAVLDQRAIDGSTRLCVALPLERLPTGYHAARIELAGSAHETHLLAAPVRAFREAARRWGLFAPAHALYSQRDPDGADVAHLRQLGLWLAERGALTATLPMLAAFLDPPVEPSPYAPVSRLMWNEAYLDLRALPESRRVPGAAATPPPGERLIDWDRLAATRRARIASLADAFFAAPGDELAELERFLAANPRVGDYARFRAAGARLGRDWRRWPARLRDGDLRAGDADDEIWRRHAWAQWRMSQQMGALRDELRARGGGLYLDLPIGVHPDSYDAWREREDFLQRCSAGAPPDPLFGGGQDWGFPPPHPRGRQRGAHAYFRACLQLQLAHSACLRLDHVIGLQRTFCIPHGLGAKDGVFVRQPAEEVYAVLAIESHRHGCTIVGEDLGTVPLRTRHALRRHDLLSMHVVQFGIGGDPRQALRPPADSLATLNTHDMPTFPGFVLGTDIEDRCALGLLPRPQVAAEQAERRRALASLAGALGCSTDTGELLERILAALARSEAALVIASLDDLLVETAPQNVPGTTTERPNWRRRLREPLESILASPTIARALAVLARGEGDA
jgi:4-alpha-glucanotransferase